MGFKDNFFEAGNKLRKFWRTPPKGKFLNLKEILCLGSASLGVSFIVNIINAYMTIGYIPTLYNLGDWGTMHATIIYIVACTSALLLTPIYGKMMQKTKSKLGRYKPYILFLAPVVSILGVMAVWSPQNMTMSARTIYVYCTTIPTLLVWNLWSNTFNLFPGVFTPNSQERTDIWSPIGLVMGFAPTLMNVLKDVFVGIWGDVIGARVIGVVSCGLGVICVFGLIGVKERVYITETESKKESVGVMQGLKMVMKNKPLMILTLALSLGCLKGAIDMTWHIVGRIKYATTMEQGAMIFGTVSMVVGFAATPNMLLLPWLTRKFNNRTIMLFWQGLNTGAYIILGIVGFQNLQQGTTSAIIITALRFVACFNAMGSLQPLMLSEIGDYQQWKTGYRLEGFIQTFAYSLVLVVVQLAALVPAVIQGLMGFNPNNYEVKPGGNSVVSETLMQSADNYMNVVIWISVASGAAFLLCMVFYNLNKKKHKQVIDELKAGAVNEDEISEDEGNLVFFEHADKKTAQDGSSDGLYNYNFDIDELDNDSDTEN